MTELLELLLEWIRSHPIWSGVIVFLVSFAESLAIVGMIVPGVVIMIGAGTLIAAGAADFWVICAWAVAGAIAGDGLSYWLGRRYQAQLRQRWPFSRYPRSLDRGEQFFRKYGGISVAFARFFGPGRATVPLVAGMLAMPPLAFLAANVGSALLWAPAYLLPGVALGASLEIASEVALRLALLLVLLIGLMWFAGWTAHRLFSLLQPRSRDWLARLLAYGGRQRLVHRIARALANPEHPEARGLAAFAGLLLVSAAGAGVLLSGLPWQSLDALIGRTLTSLRTPAVDRVMAAVGAAAEPLPAIALILALTLFYRLLGRRLTMGHWLAGMLMAALGSLLLTLAPIRPGATLVPDSGALIAAGVIGLQTIILAGSVGLTRRWLLYAGGAIGIVLIAFARLYLGVASFSGVLSALLISLAWGSAVGVAYRTHAPHERLSPPQALASAGLTVLLLLAPALVQPLRPAAETEVAPQLMRAADWRNGGWQRLPNTRADLLRDGDQPLNLQYLGDPAWLGSELERHGWQTTPPPDPSDYTRLLSASLPLAKLPLLPHVHAGRHERFAWTLDGDDHRLVLRLWPAEWRTESGDRFWLGEIGWQVKRTRFGLLSYAVTSDRFDAAAQVVVDQLSGRASVRLVPFPGGGVADLVLLSRLRPAAIERPPN